MSCVKPNKKPFLLYTRLDIGDVTGQDLEADILLCYLVILSHKQLSRLLWGGMQPLPHSSPAQYHFPLHCLHFVLPCHLPTHT